MLTRRTRRTKSAFHGFPHQTDKGFIYLIRIKKHLKCTGKLIFKVVILLSITFENIAMSLHHRLNLFLITILYFVLCRLTSVLAVDYDSVTVYCVSINFRMGP